MATHRTNHNTANNHNTVHGSKAMVGITWIQHVTSKTIRLSSYLVGWIDSGSHQDVPHDLRLYKAGSRGEIWT